MPLKANIFAPGRMNFAASELFTDFIMNSPDGELNLTK